MDGSVSFKPKDEIDKLVFVVHLSDSRHICRSCSELLKKRKNIRESLDSVNEKLLFVYKNACAKLGRGTKLKCQPAKRTLFSGESEAALGGQSKSTALSTALQLSSDGPRPSPCFNPGEQAPIKFDLAPPEDQQTHVANNLTFSPVCSSVKSAPNREAAHTSGLVSPLNLSEACSPTTGVLTTLRSTPSVVILSSTVCFKRFVI